MSYIGYARVSTAEQNLDLQIDALDKAGCARIFEDKVSGAKADRPGFIAALDYLRKGDTLVVWKLNRLGRSTQDLIKTLNDLRKKEIEFKSLQENIDTSTTGGKLIFHIFASLAEFERDVIRDRTMSGLTAARARARPRKLDEQQVRLIKKLHADKDTPIAKILSMFNIKHRTLYKYLKMET